MARHVNSTVSMIRERVEGHGPGWVFTPSHLVDLGSRTAVDLALLRLVRSAEIRRVARGLYDYPDRHPKLGLLSPSADGVARALAGRDAVRLQPTGANAANVLGLSDQVPVRIVYFTDGPSRKVQVGRQQIVLKRTTPRQMATAGTISGTVIQALRWLGRSNVSAATVATLRRQLSEGDRRQLLKDIRYAPSWVGDVLRQIAGPKSGR